MKRRENARVRLMVAQDDVLVAHENDFWWLIPETILSPMLERSLAARSAGAVVNETAAFTVVFDEEA